MEGDGSYEDYLVLSREQRKRDLQRFNGTYDSKDTVVFDMRSGVPFDTAADVYVAPGPYLLQLQAIPAPDIDLMKLREQTKEMICRAFGVFTGDLLGGVDR